MIKNKLYFIRFIIDYKDASKTQPLAIKNFFCNDLKSDVKM